jgi:hypothetical protein
MELPQGYGRGRSSTPVQCMHCNEFLEGFDAVWAVWPQRSHDIFWFCDLGCLNNWMQNNQDDDGDSDSDSEDEYFYFHNILLQLLHYLEECE